MHLDFSNRDGKSKTKIEAKVTAIKIVIQAFICSSEFN